MVGQSNMAGHGFYDKKDKSGKPLNGTLEWLVTDPRTREEFSKLKSGGSWVQRDDVWITYNQQDAKVTPSPVVNKHGKLTVGYGGPPNPHQDMMGPELGFGWTVGDALQDQVLLLKVAWGGKSLNVDYRPPSSGGKVGPYYTVMVESVKEVLGNLKSYFPSFSGDYKLAGFVWHQGWNDACDDGASKQYETNLANLIRDVRKDLGVSMPVSIGVSGMEGWSGSGGVFNNLQKLVIPAQFAVAKYPEFKGTVVSVETRSFHRDSDSKGDSPGHQIYHWNNNCESYWLVGKAMAKGMLSLLPGSELSVSPILSLATAEATYDFNFTRLPPGELQRQFRLQGSTVNGINIQWHDFPEWYVQKALKEGKDWTKDKHQPVQSVKNQAQHGFCGTFARVGALEGQWALRSGKPAKSFSVQQLVECVGWDRDQVPSLLGVAGSKSRGLEEWQDYPYDSGKYPDKDPPIKGHPCHFDASKVPSGYVSHDGKSNGFTHWAPVPERYHEDQIAAFLHHNGPVQGGINADVFDHRDHDNFVTQTACKKVNPKAVDHSILYVGFGNDAAKGPYWLIKNSWGANWADHGFIKVHRGSGCGGIGIVTDGVPVYGNPNDYFVTGPEPTPQITAEAQSDLIVI